MSHASTPVHSGEKSNTATQGNPEIPASHTPSAWRPPFAITRWVIASVLLLAALLKGYALATGPTPGTTLLDTRAFQIITVEFELLFACLLMAGFMPRKLRWACVVLFLFFAAIAGYKLWLGETTCGCFGRVTVSPAWTLLLDCGLVLLALVSHTAEPTTANITSDGSSPRRPPSIFFGGVGVGYLAVMLPLTYAMLSYTPGTLDVDGAEGSGQGWVLNAEEGDFVLLEPGQWVGQGFPLYALIEGSDTFEAGAWTVILFRSDCPHCREIMPEMIREAQLAGEQIALVEMPPFASPHRVWWPASGQGLWVGRISDRYDWFIQSPGIVELRDGVVVSASEGG
ncbi:MAG: MauE/DoxX family redox-associated membrane protein [Phycisphaerales bacterium JB063]